MRMSFMPPAAAAKASLPNGSRPGTWEITSSVISESTVAVSPAWLARIHRDTPSRMARSSSLMWPPACRFAAFRRGFAILAEPARIAVVSRHVRHHIECLSEEGTPLADEPNKVRAEIRARQAEDGKKAMAEYEANASATRAKTEKLRALRLAKEVADL